MKDDNEETSGTVFQIDCRVLCTADIPDIQRVRKVRDALARDETPFYECDRRKWTVPALRELLEGHDTTGQAAPLQEAVRILAQKHAGNPA